MPEEPLELGGIPETLLWTLYHRAAEARRPDAVLTDPLAVDLVARLPFPFAERFGAATLSQWQALRARTFDEEIGSFLRAHPRGTVVALGEGLETQSWRVDNGTMRWVSVDVPEAIDLRRRFLPHDERRRLVAASVTDAHWLDAVDCGPDVLVTAQGLLMYLSRDEVHELVARLGERCRGAGLVFDTIPAWLLERSRAGRLTSPTGYAPPPWQWALDDAEERSLSASAAIGSLRRVPVARGRGALHGVVLPALGRLPIGRRLLFSIWRAGLGSPLAEPADERRS